jgi:hypothetical protein
MHYNTTSGPFSNVFVPDNTIVTIPEDNINLVVGKNCIVTLTGSIFGNIQVSRGTTLTFESPSLDIISLKSLVAAAYAPVTIAFTSDASVRVKSAIELDVYATVNPEHKKVIFYIGTEGVPGGQLKVKATGAVFNGSVFAPAGQIQVITDGIPSAPALMTGKFIAGKILATGKHVVWNWSDCSGLELLSQKDPSSQSPLTDQPVSDNALLIYPNPSKGQFRASITIPGEETFRCLVFNVTGQPICEMHDIRVNESTECLIDLRPVPKGIYTVIFQSNGHHLVKKVLVD